MTNSRAIEISLRLDLFSCAIDVLYGVSFVCCLFLVTRFCILSLSLSLSLSLTHFLSLSLPSLSCFVLFLGLLFLKFLPPFFLMYCFCQSLSLFLSLSFLCLLFKFLPPFFYKSNVFIILFLSLILSLSFPLFLLSCFALFLSLLLNFFRHFF